MFLPFKKFVIASCLPTCLLLSAASTVVAATGNEQQREPTPALVKVLKLSWAESIRMTNENNAELLAAEADLRAARMAEGLARAGYLPTLNGTLGGTRESATGVSGLGEAGTNYELNLTATQNLFTGFGDLARVRQARANVVAAEANLKLVKARISFELKSAYQGLLFAKANVDLSQGIVSRRENNLKMVSLRYEGGRENKGSVLLSQAYLEDARLVLLQARNGLDIALATFRKVLAIDEYQPIEITEKIPVIEPGRKDIDFRAFVALTPTYEQAVAQETSAREEVAVKESTLYFPNLNLTGGTIRSGPSLMPQNDRYFVGLALSMPLYNGGRDYYASKAAAESYLSKARARETVSRTLVANLETAYSAYLEATARLRTNLAFRDALQVRAKIARAKYNQGLMSFEDWDVIENDLIDRERNYLTSGRERVTSEAAWEQSQGRGVFP
jgi:outer membrane protein